MTIKVHPILILEANEQGVGMMRPGSCKDRTCRLSYAPCTSVSLLTKESLDRFSKDLFASNFP